jgi:hypothetical protein
MSIVRGGKRRKPNYVSMINAQTPYLYPMMEAREDKAFREKQFALDEEGQRRYEEINRANLEEMKKQNKTANIIKLGELGLTAGFGIAGLGPGPGGGGGMSAPSYAGSTGIPSSPGSLKTTGTGLWSATKKPSTWGAGGAGALGAQIFGKGKSSGKKALIGAGIGAGVSAGMGLLTGKFDPYQSVVSGLLGGLGGLIEWLL